MALVRRLCIYKGASSGVYRAILDTFLAQGFKYFTDVVVRFGTDAPSESPHDPTLRQVFDRIHAVLHYRSSPMLRMHKGPRSRFLEPGINGTTLAMHVDFTEEEIERIHRLNAIHIQ